MLILKSSNQYKIKEYNRLLANTEVKVEAGADLKEVLADKDTVITYKAIAGGDNVIVEDTVLIINGKEEVEIRWKYQDLKTGDNVKWIISIGVLQNGEVKVYRGETEAIVDRSFGNDGEAFEPFLVPVKNNPNKISYTLLGKEIDKDIIDPRAMAVQKLLNNDPVFVKNIKDIPIWTGDYQND